MHKNSTAPSNSIALWQYLDTKHWDFRCDGNSTPGILIKDVQYADSLHKGLLLAAAV